MATVIAPSWIARELAYLAGTATCLVQFGPNAWQYVERANDGKDSGSQVDLGPVRWWRWLPPDDVSEALDMLIRAGAVHVGARVARPA